MTSLLKRQIEHNELIAQYEKSEYDKLHQEPELINKDPNTTALKLALILEKYLDINDMTWFSETGAAYEIIYNTIQVLRQLGNKIIF